MKKSESGAVKPRLAAAAARAEAPACTLRTMDFRVFLRRLPAASADLILTDPPYAISRKTGFAAVGKNGVERFAVSMEFGEWDKAPIDLSELCRLSYGTLRAGGTAIVFYDIWKISYLAEALRDAGFKMLRLIEWQKTNPVPLNSRRNYLTNSREMAVLGVKGGKPVFNSEYDAGIYRHAIANTGGRFHPTQKPAALFAELIRKHSHAGDLVVDPFAGGGTTAIAARQMRRRFAGCDRDKRYVAVARKRLAAADLRREKNYAHSLS